jgi:FMN phosphatase YigB (HAD superfamily)
MILFSSFVGAEDLIFDLGGVLIDTNKRLSFQCMGITNTIQYCFHCKINPLNLSDQIKNILFAILERIAQLYNLNEHDNLHYAYDEHGKLLPYLMRAWLQGTMTCDEIRALITDAIALHPEWFAHKTERRIIENLLTMIFTPEQFVATRKIDKAGITFIKKCKEHGHQVYVLSNWDSASFELLRQKYPELFSLFDGIIISGNVHALKPHKKIYQTLIEHYQLDPQHCWFIDDQQENINAAQELGIHAIVYPKNFGVLAQNIKTAYSKSIIRRENLKKIGIKVSNIKNTSNAIIDGENISLIDSTSDNCLPANA